MKGEFEAENYKDEYREALMAVIEAKIDGQPVEAAQAGEQPTKIADLMSVLEASVAAAREARSQRDSGGGEAAEAPAKVTRAKAAAAGTKPKTERKRKVA